MPAYRLLIEIHKTNDDIIELVRKTGQVKRATMSIQESIEAERSKKIEEKVNQLKIDLHLIKQENEQLEKQNL